MSGKNATTLCFNNANYHNWLLGVVEDYARAYEIDRIMWSSERRVAFSNVFGASSHDPSRATCFGDFCESKAKNRGINIARARTGYEALANFVRSSRQGRRCP